MQSTLRTTARLALVLAGAAALAPPALGAPPPALGVQDGAAPADHATSLALPAGAWTIVATRTLRPLDPGIVDLRCSLEQHTSGGADVVLDQTVVRSQAQFAPPPAQSNAFPRLAFVGVARDAAASTVSVQCGRADGLLEPQADLTTITAVKGKARSAQGRGSLTAPARLVVRRGGVYRVDATMTLRPLDPVSSDTRCSLLASSAAGTRVLDTTVVRVQAQFDPPQSSSNAFPRLAFTAAAPLRAGVQLSVGCDRFALPGFVEPVVDLATLVLTPLRAVQAQAAGGPLGGAVSLPLRPGARYAVTATATLRPLDSEALDYRCALLAGPVVLDETVVRAQGQFTPPPPTSNAFPRLGFTGLVDGRLDAHGLTVACVRIGGSATAVPPTVDLATLTASQVR
jgi:hypothetical protein